MMKDYKTLHLIMWTKYKHLCNSVVGQYFKASSGIIEVTMVTGQLYKRTSKFQFLLIISKVSDIAFLLLCRKAPYIL